MKLIYGYYLRRGLSGRLDPAKLQMERALGYGEQEIMQRVFLIWLARRYGLGYGLLFRG